MHWKDLRAIGEPSIDCMVLDAWRESPYYSDRERAAWAWTEAVTLITDGHVPDEVYAEVKPQFGDKELADLTLAVATINAWNDWRSHLEPRQVNISRSEWHLTK
jgi:alkylhydroperoxidase family enzyme